MDVAAVGIELPDGFAFKRYAETHYSVGGRVLWSDIDYIFTVIKDDILLGLVSSVRVQFYFLRGVIGLFIVHTQRVILFRIIIFTHRISYPVVTQIKAPHVGMSDEYNTIIVEYFTFVEVGRSPDVTDGRDFRSFAVICGCFYSDAFAGYGRFQMVDYSKSPGYVRCVAFLCHSPVHACQAFEKVHLLFVTQTQHLVV